MATPINLFMNWINVSITPSGGSAIALTGVKSVTPTRSSRQEAFYGDAYLWAYYIKCVEKKRSISITCANVAQCLAIPDDTPCTIVGTLLDPKNGSTSGGGAITFTLVNAVLEKEENTGANNQYAMSTVTFNAFGNIVEGVQGDPLTAAAL